MPLIEIFSRRKRAASGQVQDVYQYERIPDAIRVQAVQIIGEAIGDGSRSRYGDTPPSGVYTAVVKLLRKELATFTLNNSQREEPDAELFNWILRAPTVDNFIDAIELTFKMIDSYVRKNEYDFRSYSKTSPDDAIEELNARFKEAGFGFQFEEGFMVQVSSQFLHSETVVPALSILAAQQYESSNKEFRTAHENFRAGNYEASLLDCAKAFESVLKVIGSERAWNIKDSDPASKLLAEAFNSDFIPQWMQAEFSALRSMLESGIPTVRNKQSGHGAGTRPRNIPRELAEFQIHQTAAAILFLARHHAQMKP